VDVPLVKSPYGIVNLVGNYMVVNELKNPYENKPF
jgi:hypothetical protein